MNLFKLSLGQTRLITIFVGLGLSVSVIFYFTQLRSDFVDENVAIPPEQEQLNPSSSEVTVGLPIRLKIPAINVDATVESLGLTPQGNMDTPKGPDNVAWFNLGSRPGEDGSAVIAGHYGTWKNGKGSVFDNLHKLQPGDKIITEDENGVIVTFIVRESRNFDPKADASDVFSSDDERAHLNLITCEGTWNKDSKSYSERLVVFADKEY
jgi:LPXTG-site transpeptidase (sortase) family protein